MSPLDWPAVTAIIGVVALVLESARSWRRDGLAPRVAKCEARLDEMERREATVKRRS